MESNIGSMINLSSLYNRFQALEDKRKAKGKRYALATILMGIFLAKLCGEDKPSGIAEWVNFTSTIEPAYLKPYLPRVDGWFHPAFKPIRCMSLDFGEFIYLNGI